MESVFCNGPLSTRRFPFAGSRFCPWSAWSRHLIGVEKTRQANLNGRDQSRRLIPGLPHPSPRHWDIGTAGSSLIETGLCHAEAAFTASKAVQLLHMRCKITASLRARATLAFVIPARLASLKAQLLRPSPLTGRVKTICAASNRTARTLPSPVFEIRPVTSVSPDWYFLGVRPK